MIFKKMSALLAAMVILAGGMTACGKDQAEDETQQETESTVSAETAAAFDYVNADLTQYVTLCNYKGLDVEKTVTTVTEADIDAEIEGIREEYSHYETITDRAVAEGDTVVADYAGYRDGVAFEGGTATDAEVTASPDSGYIEGFAEAFVGQMPGEEFSFNVTFPTDYHNTDLAGVEVTFVCTVKYINGENLIVPEIDDAFVLENFQCATVEDFRTMVAENLTARKEYTSCNKMYNAIFDQIINNSTFLAYPEEEIDRLYEEYTSMYKTYAEYYGMEYSVFLEYYIGTTEEDLYAEMRNYVKEDLIMYSLIKELNAELTDIEYNERLASLASMYGMEAEDFVSYYSEDAIRATMLWEEIMGTIAESANITEVTE